MLCNYVSFAVVLPFNVAGCTFAIVCCTIYIDRYLRHCFGTLTLLVEILALFQKSINLNTTLNGGKQNGDTGKQKKKKKFCVKKKKRAPN